MTAPPPPPVSNPSSPPHQPQPEASGGDGLAAYVACGDRRALARLITVIESTRADHRAQAEACLDRLMPRTGQGIRIGISGVPGVGKSTFIESFGLFLIGLGHRVAVLAVDPSSRRSGGSILGDKTRMAELSRHPNAFIRPSPAGTTLGGVARRTAETILAVEAAGYDIVIVETVGVGQSETAVADMVDLFCLLLLPGGGDDLQGIKKGIVELADVIVVNKADGDLAPAAGRAVADYHAALTLLRAATPHWRPPVLKASALHGLGLAEIWETIGRFRTAMQSHGLWAKRRADQAQARMWSEIGDTLLADLKATPGLAAMAQQEETAVAAGRRSPISAARNVLAFYRAAIGAATWRA